MDMLFSPYGVGGIPKSAMAEIERRTEELLKSSSFQRMLELEKKYKAERLRGSQPLLPSSQTPDRVKDCPPPRPERPDSLLPPEAFLMVKATRRTAISPALSITIPKGTGSERRNRLTGWEAEQEDEENADLGTHTTSEPYQKQVKFAAPEDDGDGMSEQSSICHSPSWENYGQKKKERKLETERRKREKEQAGKEAKAAKKRATARLSKAPPPPATVNHGFTAVPLTAADRSMSDSLIVSRRLPQKDQSAHGPEDVGRTVSANDLRQTRSHRPAVTEVRPSNSDDSATATPNHPPYDNDLAPRLELSRSMSEGPAPLSQPSPSAVSTKHESRSPPDAFPPSASRTPRLRHMSPSGGNRGNGVLQGAASTNNSQESLSAALTADGGRRSGYVHYQRAQAAERAMAGLADEQLVGGVGQYYPPSRSSSVQPQHTRRSSFSQEAKSAALKLVGMRTPTSSKDSIDQTDYLTFKAIPYSSSDTDRSASVTSMATLPRSADGSVGALDAASNTGRPPTSQSSVSSADPSSAGSVSGQPNKKNRSLKDAAKAALSMSRASPKPVNSSKPSVSAPPYLRFRSRMHSRTSVQAENTEPTPEMVEASSRLTSSTVTTSVVSQAKQTESAAQEGSRASEGSSSSSAYGDGSPLLSPTTTPDTSRPHSAKDVPLFGSELAQEAVELFGRQDDERTLRQSIDSSKSTTTRNGDLGERIEKGDEDRWSRTALPIDIDCDAESFMTTVSNFDNADDAEHLSTSSPASPHSHSNTAQPEPLCTTSKVTVHPGNDEPTISIPPRSHKRSPSSPNGPHAVFSSTEHRETARIEESPNLRRSRNFARPFDHAKENRGKEGIPETHTKNHARKTTGPRVSDLAAELRGQVDEDEEDQGVPRSPHRPWTPGWISSAGSTAPSAGSASPHALSADPDVPTNPYFTDLPEPLRYNEGLGGPASSAGPPSPMSLPSPLHQLPLKTAAPRAHSAPALSLASAATSRASTPSGRSSGAMPVSILKHPKSSTSDATLPSTARPPVLSALPKHMQLQAGAPIRAPAATGEGRLAPIAKMFVECCSCKFYHDMPSKIYECMAKPDAVVEDKLLGISGAITTMVKCPWCHHNMSRTCCAGYAAVVYLKEKLH